MVSRYYLGWPLHLHRGNSASKNLKGETQRPKCWLYETPYIAAPIREQGEVIARTLPYAQLPSDAPTRTIFCFGSRVTLFSRDPSCWVLAPMSFFYKEATCKSSIVKGLLYAAKAVPSKNYFTHLTLKNARKRCWVISPNYRVSHPRHFCAVGNIIAQRYDILWDWLWDACHMAGVRWGSRREGFCSEEGPHYCFEQSVRNPTINLIHEFGNPLGIPYPSCTV